MAWKTIKWRVYHLFAIALAVLMLYPVLWMLMRVLLGGEVGRSVRRGENGRDSCGGRPARCGRALEQQQGQVEHQGEQDDQQ